MSVHARTWLGYLVLAVPGGLLWAQEVQRLENIEVIGNYENNIGTSDAASQGVVTPKMFRDRPVQRPGEVLETIPGLIISQHSGDGKANQYYLRGYNLDHGTDFATFVAGMPINMRTHAHGQGYTDLNFLIPELISRVDYHKGPYFAEDGDFASAGSARISYAESLPQNVASVTGGSFGYRRGLLLGAPQIGGGRLVYGLELVRNDGPWVHPNDFKKYNGVIRYAQGDLSAGFNVTAMGYDAKWNSSDQIAKRAVDSGLIDRFGAIDPTDGGKSSRYSLSTEWRKIRAQGRTEASAYAIRYKLNLFSNFTYFLDSSADGDQFEQADSRTIFGGEGSHTWFGKLGKIEMANKVGFQIRRDRIDPVALYSTVARSRVDKIGLFQDSNGNLLDAAGNPILDASANPISDPNDPRGVHYTIPAVTRQDRVTESSAALYFQNTVQWTQKFRTIAGVRDDIFKFQVDSSNPLNSGSKNASIFSPKLSMIFGPWAKTEYFLNYGRGFHSNDARGVTITVDPKSCAQPTGCQPVAAVTPLVRTEGYEAGLRSQVIPNLVSSLAVWRLKQASELLFTGDAGTTVPSRPSVRTGVEWEIHYIPRPWLILDVALAATRARFDDNDPQHIGTHIPGALNRAATAGITIDGLYGWFGSLQWRYFGPRPLIEDNSVHSQSTIVTNARAGYRFNKRWSAALDVFNLFNRAGSDVDYYYLSRITSNSPALNDIHFHPIDKRAVRFTISASF
jgi:outer membrane receptor protein involved in Fe transport